MSNIGVAIQQSIGILIQLLAPNFHQMGATDVYAYEFASPSTAAFPAGFF